VKFLDPASSTLDARTVSVPFAASPPAPDLIPGFSVTQHPLTWGLIISLLVLIVALALLLNADRLSRPLVTAQAATANPQSPFPQPSDGDRFDSQLTTSQHGCAHLTWRGRARNQLAL
jgi:hypothetical protein